MNCYTCGKKLKGNADTFGPRGYEMCEKCWLERVDEVATSPELHKALRSWTFEFPTEEQKARIKNNVLRLIE